MADRTLERLRQYARRFPKAVVSGGPVRYTIQWQGPVRSEDLQALIASGATSAQLHREDATCRLEITV